METLLAYLPIDRRHAIHRGENLPGRAFGTALFADVKGFTRLTEALSLELGPTRGQEELTYQLNKVYDALITQVHRYHGSVIGFSGDAITCWFDQDHGLRAVTCALEMQASINSLSSARTPGGTEITIAIKVGIASGPVRRFLVGDPAIQLIDVLAGQTLEEMSDAEKHSNKGEVVVSGEIAGRYARRISIDEWRQDPASGQRFAVVSGLEESAQPDPWPALSPINIREGNVRSWLLPAVYERLRGGQGEFLAELRPCVAVFIKFSGIDYDNDERAGDHLDAYIRWVEEVLLRYEGSLLQVTIGDKGSYLYAAFGAPVAHDDDTIRAVTAAFILQSPPPDIPHIGSVQIGMGRGQMRTGAYGSQKRRTYGVLGEKVNLAARLMGAAKPGQILCDQATFQAASSIISFETLAPIRLKGKEEPFTVYQPLVEKKKSTQFSVKADIVGREAERALLLESLKGLKQGKSRVVILEGEAGMGKSLLFDDLRQQADILGLRALLGSAEAVEANTPYYGWRAVFTHILGLPGFDSQDSQEQFLMQTIQKDRELLRLAPLLSAVLPFKIEDNEFTAQMNAQARADNTRQMLVKLLLDAARASPVMILLDDAQWLDSLSWELIVHLAHALMVTGAPLMAALATRPIEEGAVGKKQLDTLAKLETTTVLDLEPLSTVETAAVAAAHLGLSSADLPREIAELVRQKAEGNPFFAEELALTLRDQGVIVIEPDPNEPEDGSIRLQQCRVSGDIELAAQTLPGTIQGLILARLDRLPGECQLTLKVAAVIGRSFAYRPLFHVLNLHNAIPEAGLKQFLDTMTSLDLTGLIAVEPEPAYVFKHIVTHEVAYETLLFGQRRQLHLAVAEWYEAAFSNRPDEIASTLAYHFGRAGAGEKALVYLLKAGERAARLYALQEAIDHFRNALQILTDLKREDQAGILQKVHQKLGELLTTGGQYDQALPHLDTSLSLAASAGDRDAQAQCCRWLARLYEYRGEYPPALEWVRRGLEKLEGRQTADAGELLLVAGLVHTRQGQYEEGMDSCQKSLRIAQDLDESGTLARAYNLLGHITRLRGMSGRAVGYFQDGLDINRRTGDLLGQATSHNLIANAFFNTGHWRQADHHYCQARQIFGDIGDIYHRAIAENNLGGIALNQGRLDEALTFYRDALQALKNIGGSLYVLGVLYMNLGATFTRRGEVEPASRHLEIGLEHFEQAQARDFLPELHRHMAEAALRAGNPIQAKAQADTSLDLARQFAMRGEEGCALRILGEIALVEKDFEQAEEYLGKSVRILSEMEEEYEEARSTLALAKVMVGQGNHPEGRRLIDRCQPVFERLEAKLELSEAISLKAAL